MTTRDSLSRTTATGRARALWRAGHDLARVWQHQLLASERRLWRSFAEFVDEVMA